MPMDNIFTPKLKNIEQQVSAAMRNEKSYSPKESTLEFIKNFARNFRVDKEADATIQDFILN
jgi:hypothetical protein